MGRDFSVTYHNFLNSDTCNVSAIFEPKNTHNTSHPYDVTSPRKPAPDVSLNKNKQTKVEVGFGLNFRNYIVKNLNVFDFLVWSQVDPDILF